MGKEWQNGCKILVHFLDSKQEIKLFFSYEQQTFFKSYLFISNLALNEKERK